MQPQFEIITAKVVDLMNECQESGLSWSRIKDYAHARWELTTGLRSMYCGKKLPSYITDPFFWHS